MADKMTNVQSYLERRHGHEPPLQLSARSRNIVQPSLPPSNSLIDTSHSSATKLFHNRSRLVSSASQDYPGLSSNIAEHYPPCNEANAQVLSNFIQNTVAIASSGSSTRSIDLSEAPSISTQQSPEDFTADPKPHIRESLQILTNADDPRDEAPVNDSQNDGILIPTHLSGNTHKLSSRTHSDLPTPFKRQLGNHLIPVSGSQDQIRAIAKEQSQARQTAKNSLQLSRSQIQTGLAIAHNAASSQPDKAWTYSSSLEDIHHFASDQDDLNRKYLFLAQPGHRSIQSSQLDHAPHSALTLTKTHDIQPQMGPQYYQDNYDHYINHVLPDTHHPTQHGAGSYEAGNACNAHLAQLTTNTHDFQNYKGSYQNQEAHSRHLLRMSKDRPQFQYQTDSKESHATQLMQSSMRPSQGVKAGFEQVQGACNNDLARNGLFIPRNGSQSKFPQVHDAVIHEVDQVSLNAPSGYPQTDEQGSQHIDSRQLYQTPGKIHRSYNRWEFPQTQEAFNRQMAFLATQNAQNSWRSEWQSEPRPPYWNHSRQNFGIFEQSQPDPNLLTSETTQELYLGTNSQHPSRQFDYPRGQTRFHNDGVGAELGCTPSFPQIFEVPSHMMAQNCTQPVTNRPKYNHSQEYRPQMLATTLTMNQISPDTMKTPAPASALSGSSSETHLCLDSIRKETLDHIHDTPQPPIGTPRALVPTSPREPARRLIGSRLPYYPGSDLMYPFTKDDPSEALRALTVNGRPSMDELINGDLVPFVKVDGKSKAEMWGVIRIGNIPYSLTRAEVLDFLGCDAQVVPPALGIGVHIIMERTTGKTMDCYVEFLSIYDAQSTVNRLVYRGQPLRLGTHPHDRVVNVAMTSQDELMKQLFPRAKNVIWTGGKPVIQTSNEPFNTGFKSFIIGEELVMMSKHAEQPHRSSYTQRCPQRTYECMISTLAKFPWYAVDYYTLGIREQIFSTTRDMIKHLVTSLKRGGVPNLDYNLLLEVMITGLNAPGFGEKQRWELIQAAEYLGQEIRISPLAQWWPWQVLGRRAGIDEDVVKYYAHLITLHPSLIQTPTDASGKANPFGGSVVHESLELTIAEAGAKEWELFKAILRDVMQQIQHD